MNDLDVERFKQLYAFTHKNRVATIDGVYIDLRHPLIDPDNWVIGTLWMDKYDMHSGSRIWFPWFGPYVESDERWDDDADDESNVFWKTTTFVAEGDSVLIDRIVVQRGNDPFMHLHDSESRLVYLKIHRQFGAKEEVEVPLLFVGSTNFTASGLHGKITAEKIATRVCRHFSIENIHEYYPIEDFLTYEESSLVDLQSLYSDAKNIKLLLPEADAVPHQIPNQNDLERLINKAISVGYVWALAEANDKMRGPALSGYKSARGAKLAGRKSGEVRRRKAEMTWHPHALMLAKYSRASRPAASQDEVVGDIQARWALETPSSPGLKTLKAFVSTKEKSGELDRRQPMKGVRLAT